MKSKWLRKIMRSTMITGVLSFSLLITPLGAYADEIAFDRTEPTEEVSEDTIATDEYNAEYAEPDAISDDITPDTSTSEIEVLQETETEEDVVSNDAANVMGGSGTIDDPWTISTNELITGSVGSTKNFYYQFVLDQKGYIDIYGSVEGCTGTTWNQLFLYQESIKDDNLIVSGAVIKSKELKLLTAGRGLIPGKYIIYMRMNQSTAYNFKVNFTPSERYEEEVDSPVRPKNIYTDGQYYYGTCGWINFTDTDYYCFTLPQKSTVVINAQGEDVYFYCKLFSDANFSNKIADKGWESFQIKQTLDAGTYYIEFGDTQSRVYGDYKFYVSASGDSNPKSPNTFKGVNVQNGGGLSGLDSALNLVTKDDGKTYTTEMVKGQKYTLGTGTWESSNKSVASVIAKTGAVTAKAAGEAVLTEKQSGTTVSVKVFAPAISGAKKLNLVIEEATNVKLNGLDSSSMPVTWQSSNSEVAFVSGSEANAMIFPLGKGKAKITAWVGGKSLVYNVNVKDVYSIGKLSGKDSISLNAFQKVNLTYTNGFKPEKATWVDEKGAALGSDSPVTIRKKVLTANAPIDAYTIIGNDGTTTVTLTITVKCIPVKTDIFINKGSSKTLKHSLVKGNDVTWTKDKDAISLANENTAKVKITGVNADQVLLTCTKGSAKYDTNVRVEDPTPKDTNIAMNVGATRQIEFAHVVERIMYSSSNKAVAFVDENGNVYARKTGKATISAKIAGKAVKIKVTVTK